MFKFRFVSYGFHTLLILIMLGAKREAGLTGAFFFFACA